MKNRKFLFINLCVDPGSYTGLNHGIAFLVPVLKRHGYEVSCLTVIRDLDLDRYVEKIAAFAPDIVGFSATSHQLRPLIRISNRLRQEFPAVLQLAGGPGPTIDPETIFAQGAVDGICIGEGEATLASLLSRIAAGKELSDTEGFFWKQGDTIKRNPIPPFLTDLDQLDFPDYSIFPRMVDGRGNLWVVLSRGCPYDCYYCCNTAKRKYYPSDRGYFRMPTVEYCLRFLEQLKAQYPQINFIMIEDDLLIANAEWFERFAAEYSRRIGIPYRVCVRVECLTPAIVAALRDSGCQRVFMGVESGSEDVRARLLNKRFSNALILEKGALLKAAGIEILSLNMIGLPTETPEQMQETVDLNRKLDPERGVCSFFYPYKGTELHRICQQQNLLKSEDEMLAITHFNIRPAIRMSPEVEAAAIRYRQELLDLFDSKLTLLELLNINA